LGACQGNILFAIKQQVACAFDELLPCEFQSARQPTAYFGDLLVGEFDDVKVVED
jgi:hypothetical protein